MTFFFQPSFYMDFAYISIFGTKLETKLQAKLQAKLEAKLEAKLQDNY